MRAAALCGRQFARNGRSLNRRGGGLMRGREETEADGLRGLSSGGVGESSAQVGSGAMAARARYRLHLGLVSQPLSVVLASSLLSL